MRIRFWGVRGSIASPGPETAGVGGNTSCVEVMCGKTRIVLDAGTGMRGLGNALLDLDLGDGDGADVAARLRATNGALPIAFFTSERGTEAVARAAAIGPVFAKPDDLDAAVDWIRRAAGPC